MLLWRARGNSKRERVFSNGFRKECLRHFFVEEKHGGHFKVTRTSPQRNTCQTFLKSIVLLGSNGFQECLFFNKNCPIALLNSLVFCLQKNSAIIIILYNLKDGRAYSFILLTSKTKEYV